MMTVNLLDRILQSQPAAFALLHRPDTVGPAMLDVLVGEISTPDTLAEIPLSAEPWHGDGPRHQVLVIVPYRQIAERGFSCVDDGSPLISMTITHQDLMSVAAAIQRLPEVQTELVGGHFDLDDDTYADMVRKIIADEIGEGEGANFVIKRSFVADISSYTPHSALSIFRQLLLQESGAYWTFIVHTGMHTFVGATPERHISLCDGTAVMNPISGTYCYPPSGPTLKDVLDFLADRKEADELYMVVDEELKMMARICESGGQVVGPYLKEMARLAHTEYFIKGHSTHDPRDILRETMFAPTVIGSPLESACRIIARYEPYGRGYYSGVIALMGCDAQGHHTLDSSIIIRTADIHSRGRVDIGVGATLVRHSDPRSEVAETRTKAAGLLAALGTEGRLRFGGYPSVQAALAQRNTAISSFWLAKEEARVTQELMLAGQRVLIVDAEDNFTAMLDLQLRSMGLSVTMCRFDEPYTLHGYDLIVMGPGPGDPREIDHPKIAHLSSRISTLLTEQCPFLAICLSHQVLSARLGFTLVRRDVPNQGIQREIDLFGSRAQVGFYNTFAARSYEDKVDCEGIGVVEVSRDITNGEVHALRGPHFASLQFHPESVLTQNGVRIVSTMIKEVLHI